ncbi:RING-H2 finger protein ATL18-like [Nicotiana tomentosiformis]|uniref:RING-H2 finger protein ATL18-like n=1 Tax=Nicotiana tomentosiformis TaxID=4098 RepID=UPI00051AEF85
MRPASSAITFFIFLFISIYILKKTLKTFPRSSITIVLNYVVFIANQLKWAWEILLLQSFSHPYNLSSISRNAHDQDQDHEHELEVMHYEPESESSGSVECAVCLCKIEEGEEVRELRCDHLFHRVCLDRWLGTGHMTCPLCRNHLKPPPLVANLHQEVISFDFVSGTRSRDRYHWWLR